MSKVAIITANYDCYDIRKDVYPQSIDVEWIYVHDNIHESMVEYDAGWKMVYEPRPHIHPNRAAKTPKCLPWLYTDASASIWIDASFQVKSSHFADDVIHYADPIAQFPHPWRDCAYAEARECIAIPKYAKETLQDQIDVYEEYGHPENWGLWATGVIARQHTPEVIQMGFDWLANIYRYSYQDQVSHPFVCRSNGLRPIDLPGSHLGNEWLDYQGSGRHSHG